MAASATRPTAAGIDTRLDPRRPWAEDLLIEMPGGVAVAVANDLISITTYVLAEQNDWFEPEIAFFRTWFGRGMRAYDVGANHGVYALTLAALAGSEGAVTAFEPGLEVRQRLQRSIAANHLGNVQLVAAAAAEHAGHALLHMNGASEAASLLSTTACTGERVAVTTLDLEWSRQGEPPIDLVKIDVEGAEAEVLRGARRLLAATSPLVMFEISGEEGRLDELAPLFAAFGYGLYRLLPGPGLLVPLQLDEISRFQLNLFACKPDRAASLAAGGLLVPALGVPVAVLPCDAAAGLRTLACWNEPAADAVARETADAGCCDSATRRLAHGWRSRVGTPGRRAADLLLAGGSSERPLRHRPRLSVLSAIARCAADSGARERALTVLGELSVALDDAAVARDLPLLPAAPSFDAMSPDDQPDEWLRVMTVDALVTLHCHSTRFTHGDALTSLDRWRHSRFFGPHLERRRQLLSVRLGLQAGLHVTPPLRLAQGSNAHLYQ